MPTLPDRADAAFATHLERAILKVLSGDDNTPGLYRSVLSSPNWDSFNRTTGMIHAYETVLQEMRNVAVRMNGEAAAAQQKSMN